MAIDYCPDHRLMWWEELMFVVGHIFTDFLFAVEFGEGLSEEVQCRFRLALPHQHLNGLLVELREELSEPALVRH